MPQPSRRRRLALVLVAVGFLSAGCAGDDRFNADNVRAHIERLTSNGSRSTGSPSNEKARAYTIETLQLYGFDVRVQEADATWREAGVNTRVSNIIAIKPGAHQDAIGLVSHIDSVAWGPGAGDDAIGTAVLLETARVLAERPDARYSLMLLVTDGEEHGLMGARALVDDPEVRARLKTVINLEAIGTAGPFALFETGPGTSPALRAWASATRPRGGSYMQAIYDALPNDTDFSVLKELPGVSGVNFAATGDGYTYHTDRDRADRVTPDVMRNASRIVIDIVSRLDAMTTLDAAPTRPMYFSVLDRTAFLVSQRTGVAMGWLAVVLGTLAWVGMLRQVVRNGGIGHAIVTIVWATLAAAAVLGALLAAVWLLRAGRAELHPWFAHPWRLFAFMTVMVVTVTWLVRRLAAALPAALRPDGTPFGVWSAALPVWTLMLVGALLHAPSASYLLSIPLLAAALLVGPATLVAGAREALRTWPARVASAVVVALVWILWTPDLVALLPFLVTLLGRLPVVTPTWLYPAAFFFAGIVLWPPILGVLVGRVQWRLAHGLAGSVMMLALVVSGLLAWMAPAFTEERPQQRSAIFVDDRVRQNAQWELYGNEPGVDIGAGGPANVAWESVAQSAVTGAAVAPKAHLFRARVPNPSTVAPATITATVARGQGDADVEVTVVPVDREWSSVAIVLPESIVPTRSSLAGRTRGDRWQARLTVVPADGMTWRATIPASQADRLGAMEVWVSRFTLPDAVPGGLVPAWLQAPHTAWMTQHVVMLPVVTNDVQQVPTPLAPLVLPVPSSTPASAAPLAPAPTPGTGVPR